MLKRLIALVPLLAGLTVLHAATYYISPTGDDNNPGTSSQPWATYPQAVRVARAGDTVLVQAGIYSRSDNTNFFEQGTLVFTASGTSNALITFRAIGPVTNRVPFEVRAPYYYFDGFTWDGIYAIYVRGPIPGGSMPGPGSGYVTMTNCTVQNTMGQSGFGQDPPLSSNKIPETAPGHCTIINCTFNRMTNAASCVNLQGVGNLVQGCIFANGVSQDAINLWGSNNVIRLNTFTNMSEVEGFGNHPDILQTFGDNGFWCVDMLFERNYVVNCPIQLMQFEQGPVLTNTNLWGIELRNNVFEDSNMQCSLDVANVRFYNNTFRRCGSLDKTPIINFTFYDPGWSGFRGAPCGGKVINNAFIDCNTAYSAAPSGPNAGNLTNSTNAILGRAHLWLSSDYVQVYGVYSNLTGTITSGTVYCASGDCYTVDATNFAGGTFNVMLAYGTAGVSADAQWNAYYNNSMFFRINTTTMPAGEVKGALLSYTADLSSFLAGSDYNYGGLSGELHGLQSGDTKLAATNAYPCTLAASLSGSVLIDRGMNLSSLGVTNDFSGAARPQGAGFDIGAFEYSGGQTQSRPTAPVHLSITSPGR